MNAMPTFSWSTPKRPIKRAAVPPSLDREGVSLDRSLRVAMERGFGHDFGAVRLHNDGVAHAATRAARARALTIGTDVALGPDVAPATERGRHTLAHELAHVVQQAGSDRRTQPINTDGAAEREADSTASLVLGGGRANVRERQPVAVQCEGESEKPPTADPGQVILDGLVTVAEQIKDNNPEFRRRVIEPLTLRLEREWGRLPGGAQAGIIGFSAAALTIPGGVLLADPDGRRVLADVNLAAPLTLIPGAPLTHFAYTMPSGEGATQRTYGVRTNVSLDALLEPVRRRLGWQKLTLSAELGWAYDPVDDQLRLRDARATLGILPGVTISGGTYPDLLTPRQILPTTGGGTAEVRQELPAAAHTPTPDVRVLLQVDLLKLGRSGAIPGLGSWLGNF